MSQHRAAHLCLGHQVMDCEKTHGFSATLPRAEPREDQPSPVWPPPVRSSLPAASSSRPSRTPARNGRTAREQPARGVLLLPPADENVGTGVTTLSHLLRAALRLPEGHPRQQRAHR